MRKLHEVALGLVVCAAVAVAAPATALGGSISGRVTAEDGGAPISGIQVCQYESKGGVEESCTQTDAGGDYALTGLPAGSYKIRFSAWLGNLKWVDESYDDKLHGFDPVGIAAGEDRGGIDAALAEGGSIGGTVVDELTKAPIADVWVCANAEGIPVRCAYTGTGGEYRVNGLPTGSYKLELEGGNRVSYLHEYYEDAESGAGATPISVVAPELTAGIDAEMAPGAQILGRVTAAGDGAPLANVFVCAMEVAPGEHEACDSTGADGFYAIRSLPAATYLVAFERQYLPITGWTAGQWWEGASSEVDATPISIAPPETRSGIDGQLNGVPVPPGDETSPTPPPARVVGGRSVALATGLAKVRRGRALVRLRCAGRRPCAGALRLVARIPRGGGKAAQRNRRRARGLTIGASRFSVPAGRLKVVRVRLTRRGRALFRRSAQRGLKVRLIGSGVRNRALKLRG